MGRVELPPRPVQGFYKKPELELLIQRRTARKALADAKIDGSIVERYYESRAIRRVGEAFDGGLDRKTLLTMATGAGKARTVMALCELLMRCNWAKRVLFLADRVALVRQAVNAFKKFLPDTSPVNLVTEKDAEGRVFVSTYPTMMGLIEEARDGQRRFGVGHFDLVIIDEAHRSVYQKYGAIFEYFDSLLVGLTANRKTEPIETLIDCLTLKTACRPIITRLTKRSGTAFWCPQRRFPYRCDSSEKELPTTNCPKKKRKSGMRSTGTTTVGYPIVSKPRQ